MSTNVRPIPQGYHSITPGLIVRDAASAIEFYKRAFGAQELGRMTTPDGKRIAHAEIKIGDSIIFVNDEFPDMGYHAPPSSGGATGGLYIYTEDADKMFQQAVEAGAKVRMPVTDMFWGDRYGKVTDPFGHEWGIATHKEDVLPEEMRKRAEAFFSKASSA